MNNKVFNIPFSQDFAKLIASNILEEYKEKPLEMADVLFLLPNRRACKTFADSFIKLKGETSMMLPRFVPIADIDDEELLISILSQDDKNSFLKILPEISKIERTLLFTRIIKSRPSDFGMKESSYSQSSYLANALADLIDSVENEDITYDNLANLVPDEYSINWQETLKFLEIITNFWPDILRERNVVDASTRRNLLIKMQAKYWNENPINTPVIVAGTTATFPAMKELVKSVTNLPNGQVILQGIDNNLSDEAWANIDETHPQFELKDLLEYLNINRKDVAEYKNHDLNDVFKPKEMLISQMMLPAEITNKWRELNSDIIDKSAIENLTYIDCDTITEEAISIALIMRKNLDIAGRTISLVTPDRALARRVSNQLYRWGLEVDDSAGIPLHQTAIGLYLRQLVSVVENEFSPIEFLSLLKHPLSANGIELKEFRKNTRKLEQKFLRGVKPQSGINSLIEMVSLEEGYEYLALWLKEIESEFSILIDAYKNEKISFKELIEIHINLAERFARKIDVDGADVLWKGEAGEAAAKFIANLYEYADILGEIEPREYLSLLEALSANVTIRSRYGSHPRLSILGPIEARLTSADIVITAGVNEGVWPKTINADPWMSRPMKKDFGLPMPEKSIGVMAHDFCSLISAKKTYITRSKRVEGTPMVESRWILRLKTVLNAINLDIKDLENEPEWLYLAKKIDMPKAFSKINPPSPKPPVSARPRKLSVSAMEMWARDPYSIFAKHILNLRKLDDIEADISIADYGNIIHEILEEFYAANPRKFPDNAKEKLLNLGKEKFEAQNITPAVFAFWRGKFEKIIEWICDYEIKNREGIVYSYVEKWGSFRFKVNNGEFEVYAKADRIDETKDRTLKIIDYKTGSIKSKSEIYEGYAPQLPLEAIIAKNNGFEEIDVDEIQEMDYWKLSGSRDGSKVAKFNSNVDELLDSTMEKITEMINKFDDENIGYESRPNPKFAPKYSDYNHLARVAEWASSAEDGGDE
jgi:ATP-dependent helicase/nuclease subunit B